MCLLLRRLRTRSDCLTNEYSLEVHPIGTLYFTTLIKLTRSERWCLIDRLSGKVVGVCGWSNVKMGVAGLLVRLRSLSPELRHGFGKLDNVHRSSYTGIPACS